jgi:hypothetical protein
MKPNALLASLLCSIFLTGCVHKWQLQLTPTAIAQGEKIAIPVVIPVSQELLDAKWEALISPTDKANVAVGQLLVPQLENLGRSVLLPPSDEKGSTDAVLAPRLVSVKRTQPTTIFGDQTTTIVLEFTLKDKNGKLLWLDTVTGSATTKMTSKVKASATRQFQMAFDQVFNQAAERIRASPEVRGARH